MKKLFVLLTLLIFVIVSEAQPPTTTPLALCATDGLDTVCCNNPTDCAPFLNICVGTTITYFLSFSPLDSNAYFFLQVCGPNPTVAFQSPGGIPTSSGTLPISASYTVTYNTIGNFTVTASTCPINGIDCSAGCFASNTFSVNVVAPPSASFFAIPSPQCYGDTICFVSTSSPNDPAALEWIVDGVSYSCNQVFCDTIICFPSNFTPLLDSGQHIVSLIAGSGWCKDTITDTIYVTYPDPYFAWHNECKTVIFYDSSLCAQYITAWQWDFGDGSPLFSYSAYLDSVVYAYSTFGQYNVTLTITDIYGNTYSYTDVIIIPPPIQPSIVVPLGATICDTTTLLVSNIYPPISWQTNNGVFIGSNTNDTVTIAWTNPNATNTYVIVTGVDTNGCEVSDTAYFPPCCDCNMSAQICIENQTASQVLQMYSTFVTNGYQLNLTLQPTLPIIINGTFTIDTKFEFLNCQNVTLAGNAVIAINDTLILTNDTLRAACGYMWDGVYINQNKAALYCNNTTMRQARNAIVSLNAGLFRVTNGSILRDNFKGIWVKSYPFGPHPGFVSRTTFTTVSGFIPAIPALPPNNNRTHIGIEIDTVAGIVIGDTTLLANFNLFSNVDIGAYVKVSNSTFLHNRFLNINFIPNLNVASGVGIWALGTKTGLVYINQALRVGGFGTNNRCQFNLVSTGIAVINEHDLDIQNNLFTDSRFYGIFVQNAPGKTMLINGNRFLQPTIDFAGAISCTDVYNSSLTINNNNILQNSVNQNGTGIFVGNVASGPVMLTANFNNIQRTQTGIYLINISGGNSLVFQNRVGFLKPVTAYTFIHAGIRIAGCDFLTVDENIISRGSGGNATQSMVTTLRGISVENSTNALISENILRFTGSGIYVDGACAPLTWLVCNELRGNWNGIFFNNANINNQIQIFNQISQHNLWFTPVSIPQERLGGSVVIQSPLVRFNYRTTFPNCIGGSCNPNPYAASLIGNLNVTNIGVGSADICGLVLLQQLSPQDRDSLLGIIVNNQKSFSIDSIENKFWDKLRTYRYFRQNPGALQLNVPNDGLYQSFYQQCANDCIGTIENINDNIASGNTPQATNLNNSFSPQTLIEQNRKTVNSIYLNTWANGQWWFTSADSVTLLSIASQDPVTNGDAVYSARVMLKFDPVANTGFRTQQDQTNANLAVESTVYPNPTTGLVYYDYSLVEGEQGVFEIYDLLGKKLISVALKPDENSVSVDTSVLNGGIYIFSININGKPENSGKLIVIKE
ncbi:MAG: PKD domain-containing protein [Bacteroidota bacterium]